LLQAQQVSKRAVPGLSGTAFFIYTHAKPNMKQVSDISRRQFCEAWTRASSSNWNIEQLARHLDISVPAVRGRKCYYEANFELKFTPLKKVERPHNKKERATLQAILNKGAKKK
jgi:hypothetical protein